MLIRTSASKGAGSAQITGFYDEDTGSVQYLVVDPATSKGAVVDVVMGFDHRAARTDTDWADHIMDHAKREGIEIEWILDTHPHADHLMASAYLRKHLDKPNAIGAKVTDIAELWRDYYNLPDGLDAAGAFDQFWNDGDTFRIGELPVRVMLSPGHTLGSITYVVGDDAALVHDTFMQPDVGTSRADFPGGTAGDLYDSLQEILKLPDHTRLFVGHDYGTKDREKAEWESTVAEQRENNAHIGGGVSREDYIALREARDKTLPLPDRMLHVLQMNLRAGRAPETENDGNAYLKIPLNRF